MRDGTGVKVLMYHWVSPDPGQKLRAWGATPDQFESQMRQLAEAGYESVSLDDVVDVVRGVRPIPDKAVALTFDDGYRDLLEHVWPVLERYGFRGTVFLVSDRMGRTNDWDAPHGDAPRELLGWSDAAELARRGMEMGSHARTHRFLPSLSDRELEDEIRGSKETIQDRLGRPARFFSYPHGLYDRRCLSLVAAAGYEGACSDIRGGNRAGTDPFLLRRSLMTCHDTAWSLSFKLRTGFGAREWLGSRLEELRRRVAPAPGRVAL